MTRHVWAAAFLAGCAAGPPVGGPPQGPVEGGAREAGESWAVYFRDLSSDELIEINTAQVFHAASTMKVLVLMKVLRDVVDGKYRLEDEVPVKDTFTGALGGEFRTEAEAPAVREAVGTTMRVSELIRWMITVSDNLATNVLIELAGGPGAVTRHARLYGCIETVVARYIMDTRAFDAGLSSRVQPREMGQLLERIWRGEVVSPEASKQMLEILGGAGKDWMGFKLPEGSRAAHKTGAIEGTRHDAGIITLPGGHAFVLCIFSAGLKDEAAAERAIAETARVFCDHAAAAHAPPGR